MNRLILAVSAAALAATAFAQGTSNQGPADAQTAAMIQAINHAEISQAKVAEQSAQSPAVKRFAHMMLRDHSKNDSQLASVDKRQGIQPEATSEVQALSSQAQETTQQLQARGAGGFDAAYIEAQIKEHQQALDKLDSALASTSNKEFRRFIESTRETVARHLGEAKRLQGKLGESTQPSGGNQ